VRKGLGRYLPPEKVTQSLPLVSLFPVYDEKIVRAIGEVLSNLTVVAAVPIYELLFSDIRKWETIQDASNLIQFFGGVSLRVQHVCVTPHPPLWSPHRKHKLAAWKPLIQLAKKNNPWPVFEGLFLLRHLSDPTQTPFFDVVNEIEPLALMLVSEDLEAPSQRRCTCLCPADADDS